MSKKIEDEGQVTEQLQNLKRQVERLTDVRSILAERLRMVTRDEGCLGEDPEQEKMQELVPMATSVRGLVVKLATECDLLEALHYNLEV